MRSRDQVIWDFVQAWLRKADSDLRAAEFMMTGTEELDEHVGFHCQQAAEKHIKAYLVRHQIEFPKSHDLAELRGLVETVDTELAASLAPADWLTPFGVEMRYPSRLSIDRPAAERAVKTAHNVKGLIREALRDYLSSGRPSR